MKRRLTEFSSTSSRIVRGRGTGAIALVTVAFGLVLSLITVPVATADECPNAIVRAQNGSTELPECRGYEMVSSAYKEGFGAIGQSNVPVTDGGVLGYLSQGTFAGNQGPVLLNWYRATRSATGWMTSSISLPNAIYDTAESPVAALSADLQRTAWFVPRPTPTFYFRDPDGTVTRVGEGESSPGQWLAVAGASSDLSHLVLYSGEGSRLYEHVGTGNEGPPREVTVDNDGQVQTSACFGSISPDGRVVVYSTGCPFGTRQVWARIGGSVSVAVSGSECTRTSGDPGGACNSASGAAYAGGAADGSRVFFTTSQQLVNGDTDAGNDLYACDLPTGVPAPVGPGNPCATLTELSAVTNDARVENVVEVSEDGSRAYFVAQGVLADNVGVGGLVARAGAHNLYVWERGGGSPAGTVRFVVGLDDDKNDLVQSQTTSDGRYLLFMTANQLVKTGPGEDTDQQVDVYRYDAVTKTIARVSTSVSGSGGNEPGFDVVIPGKAMTADGATVIFDTAEPLSVSDTDGVNDVYVWRDDGGVSSISAGGGRSVGISPSGRDLYFSTNVPMASADRDLLADIYDARIGGGFAPVQTTACSGDPCQGQRSQPPGLAAPSAPATSDGNVELGKRSQISLESLTAKQLKAASRTGVLPVRVRSSSAGKLSLSARASMGRVARKTVSVRKAGTVKIRLRLSSAARQRLRNGSSLRVTLSVAKKGARTRSSSVRLPGVSS